MFRNYLSFEFASAFHRDLMTFSADTEVRNEAWKTRLVKSAETMYHHFARAVHARDPKDKLLHFSVALIAIRDCGDILKAGGAFEGEIKDKYDVLHGRLEMLMWDMAEAQGGQFRLLG